MTETLTVEEGRILAADLLNQLTPLLGDADAIDATLAHWERELGAMRLAMVCVAAVQTVFTTCLTRIDLPSIATKESA